ncbi:adenylate/guanylate cyclase domain-containing protein [Haloechinothrix sp. YIM 98757]|uniref:Adenylate/guanylate cyclase domain-containing protein n=1 Tax=Haloechinothrix aidingensis TaxID=2752311 RepID=A0A838AB54_9PSEU|nr:adenylate/guanylate cyclase domain-containing protein [Haloechinothrix aidingensis]MBA0126469.1 adenylate/guanylate cyclase domain-containing protein [Haloechinothrix aidingensis]
MSGTARNGATATGAPAVPSPGGPLGSRLLGHEDERDDRLRVRVQTLLTGSILLSNLIGIAVVAALVTLVIPGPEPITAYLGMAGWLAVAGYVLLAVVIGLVWGTKMTFRSVRWALEGRRATELERHATLGVPWRLTGMQALLWLVATVLLTAANSAVDAVAMVKVAATIGLGGVVVCANSYLLSEFALRPVAARALADAPPQRPLRAGVITRTLWAWGLGTVIPVAGLMLVAAFTLVRHNVTATQLSVTILAMGAVTVVFGFLLILLMTRATVAPIRTVSAAMEAVEAGDLSAHVSVFDATELGVLQSRFNGMAAGLRERERIRDIFGRHVGREVAQLAVSTDFELGGEVREAAVLFVDVMASTALAATRPPTQVVELLNRFFAVVVSEIETHHGLVNKFEGDAALAVFGAPHDLPDAAGQALAAARAMAVRLRREVGDCEAGIGVAAGPVVAGNVGAQSRYEYTVIGDPVNEAARLTDIAKDIEGGLVASGRAVEAADPAEAGRWRRHGEVTLRGRSEPTQLAVPDEGPASP